MEIYIVYAGHIKCQLTLTHMDWTCIVESNYFEGIGRFLFLLKELLSEKQNQ